MMRRRQVLRGMLGGAAVTVALPLLDCFLDSNGAALANGAALPVRFGTWTWGCGMQASRWVPSTTGADYDFPAEIKSLEPYRRKLSLFTGFTVKTDGRENLGHRTGSTGIRCGVAPSGTVLYPLPTIDVLVSDGIGGDTRFRSIEMSAMGNPTHSYSARSTSVINAAVPTPQDLYERIFGPEFQDPNAAGFKPDPRLMVRTSVLSAVKDDRDSFVRGLGAADQARMEEYFTSLRQIENQLSLQLQKPEPLEACRSPEEAKALPSGTEVDAVAQNHRLMAQILAHALACNQTKVFNMVWSDWFSSLRRQGQAETQHGTTHNEAPDPKLGYQVEVSWFVEQTMMGFAEFLKILDGVREGAGTLLDNTILFAHSDTAFARQHTLDGIPMMVAGTGGGRLKSGLHVAGNGEVVTRLGLTLQQAMKIPVEKWGAGTMQTAKPISEILV
jgi:hypothetical protein